LFEKRHGGDGDVENPVRISLRLRKTGSKTKSRIDEGYVHGYEKEYP
jgi:hypothetical protein